MSTTGSNLINATGAGRFDVAKTVEGLVEADRAAPQARIDKNKASYETQLSAYGVLKSSISSFQAIASPLSNPDTFNARSLAFPDSDFIRPEAIDPGAQLGTYQLEVTQVAQSQTLVSGELDEDQNLGDGTLTFNFMQRATQTVAGGVGHAKQVGTSSADESLSLSLNNVDISLVSTGNYTADLTSVVDKINESTDQSGVRAVLDGGDGIRLESVDGSDFTLGYNNDEGAGGGDGGATLSTFGMADVAFADKFVANEDKEALEIEVKDGDTIEDLVEKINKSDSDVQASILETDGKKQLMLTAPSGETQQLEITATGSAALNQFTFDHDDPASALLLTQEGRDSKLKVNGLDVRRSSNKVDDVIPGLTFTLDRAMASSSEKVTFTVTEDKTTAKQAIENFVEGYNALQATFINLTGVKTADPEEGIEEDQVGVLSRDATAKGLYNSVRSILSAGSGAQDQEIFLAELGIRTKLDGSLEFDDTKGSDGKTDFDRMIDKDFDRLQSLFALSMDTSHSEIEISTARDIGSITSGTYELEITQEPERSVTTLHDYDNWLFPGGTGFKVEIGDGSSGGGTISTGFLDLTDISGPAISAAGAHEEFAKALEDKINADENFKRDDITIRVEAVWDDPTLDWELKFTSEKYGDNREISFSAINDPGNAFGLAGNVETVDGKDVQGSINGEEGFGSGDYLLPKLGGTMSGVNFKVGEGTLGTSTFTFERGMAGDLNALLARATRSTSSDTDPSEIGMREKTLNDKLEGLEKDQETLDERLEKARKKYTKEYSLLDSIMRNFSRSQETLTNLLTSWQASLSNK